jgi:VWFA-related protein
MGWRIVAAVVVLASGSLVLAQQGAPGAQEPIPTFRAGIEAVQFDVIVIGPDGQPVTDLTLEDFELLENRSPQAITTSARVDIPPVSPRGQAEAWAVDPDVQTNDRPEGRVYLFALDEMRPDRALRTRAFLRQFLEEYFGPDDLAAVVLVGRGLVTSGHGFTSSPRRLLAAIDEFSGGMTDLDAGRRQCVDGDHQESRIGVRPPESVHMRNRVARIRELVESMTGIPGGRKSILYFNECIGYDMFSIRDYTGGVLTMAGEDAHAAMAAATRGNVTFYTFDPSGLEPLDGGQRAMNDRMDLASLAHVTGGFALSNSNNYADAFDRIVTENSTYYVLGFNSSYTRRDGRFVPVEVRVARPGVTVRAREGYVAPLGAPRGDPPAPASAMSAALANPLSTRGLPIRAVATAYGGNGREAAVALTAEIDVSGLPLVARDGQLEGTLEISYAATDDRYRAYPGAVHAVRFSRPGDAGTPPPGSWVRLVTQLALPPGAYQLRVAAGSATRAGSVLYDLDVPDLRGRTGRSGRWRGRSGRRRRTAGRRAATA